MISLRQATPIDYPKVNQIENQIFHSMSPSEFSSYYLENDLIEIKMILKNDNVIGYIVIWLDLDKSQIYSIYINPANRRQHYAYQALLILEKELIERGISNWTLEVRKSNQAAIKLYQKLGFKIVVSRDNYYQDHEDAWLMLKKL